MGEGISPATANPTLLAQAAAPPAAAQKPAPKAKAAMEDPRVTYAAPVQKNNNNKSAGPATSPGNPETFPAGDLDLVSTRVSLAAAAAVAPVLGSFTVGPSLLAQAAAPPAAAQKPAPASAWASFAAAALDVPDLYQASIVEPLHVGHGPTVEEASKPRQTQIQTTLDTLNNTLTYQDVIEILERR